MFMIEARSIVLKIDIRGAPSAKYFPSGAMRALSVKHEKITHVYRRALMTMEGFSSQTAEMRGPVDIPTVYWKFKFKAKNPISPPPNPIQTS